MDVMYGLNQISKKIDGLSLVEPEDVEITYTQNGEYDIEPASQGGISSVHVTVDVDQGGGSGQSATLRLNHVGNYTSSNSDDVQVDINGSYDGLSDLGLYFRNMTDNTLIPVTESKDMDDMYWDNNGFYKEDGDDILYLEFVFSPEAVAAWNGGSIQFVNYINSLYAAEGVVEADSFGNFMELRSFLQGDIKEASTTDGKLYTTFSPGGVMMSGKPTLATLTVPNM